MCGALRASRTAPTSDWLMTDVGPPDCPMTALPFVLLIRSSALLDTHRAKPLGLSKLPDVPHTPSPTTSIIVPRRQRSRRCPTRTDGGLLRPGLDPDRVCIAVMPKRESTGGGMVQLPRGHTA